MKLSQIYQPIERELSQVEQMLEDSLKMSKYKSILRINRYLLDAKGKRLRPALVILCAKATLSKEQRVLRQAQDTSLKDTEQSRSAKSKDLVKIASSIELIHMASLIHDDVIDHAHLRHNQPTINVKWGQDASIALGDYLYSVAFQLISSCANTDILECISQATKSMCEGELIQVLERDNLDLLKERYIVIVKKKTANLFAASCQSGAMLVNPNRFIQSALKEYGLNFGIVFQMVDDCLDLIGQQKDLGKSPGTDFKVGELTLPVLNLLSLNKDKSQILSLLRQPAKDKAFKQLKERFINSGAFHRTKKDVSFYIQKAKDNLSRLETSCFKQSLFALADYVAERIKEEDLA